MAFNFPKISPNRKFLGTVLGGGAVGGFASILLPPIGDNPIVTTWLASTFLGALAALLFVVVISNTDRSDMVRLLAISVVAGITWQPIILGLREAQRNAVLDSDIVSLEETVDTVTELEQIASAPRPEDETEKAEYLENVDAVLNDAVESARTVTTAAAQTTASTILTSAIDNYRGGSELVLAEERDMLTLAPPPSRPSRILPDPQDVEFVLTLDSPLAVEDQGSTDVFVRIDIPEPARYTVDVTSDEGQDLVASIYRSGDLRPMAINDDSGDSLNPRITDDFIQGEYYLHIRSFFHLVPVAEFDVVLVREIGDGNETP